MKWDWGTQVTNAPGFLASESDPTVGLTNGTIYVHGSTLTPLTSGALDGYVATNHSGKVRISAPGSLAIGNSMDSVYANSSASLALGANAIVERCYGGMALGIYAHTTNQFAFVYAGDSMAGKYYGDHGAGTFNINPIGGLSGFWIGETNLATYLAPVKTTVNTTKGLVSITAEQQAAITALYPNVSNGAKVLLEKGNGTGPNGYPQYDLYLGSASSMASQYGGCELYPDGTIRLYAGSPDLVAIFGPTQAGNPAWLQTPAIVGYEPYYYAYQGTKLTPYDEVKDMVSDAIPNQIVTRINGKTGGLDIGVFGDETSVSVKTNFPSGIEIGSVIVQEGWHSVSVVEEDQSSGAPGFNPVVTNKLYVPSNLSAYNNDAGYVTASALANHTHDRLVSDNNESELVMLGTGKAAIKPKYYTGEQNGVTIKFSPAIPIEFLYEVGANETNAVTTEMSMQGTPIAHLDGYTVGSSTILYTNIVKYVQGNIPSQMTISYPTPYFAGAAFTIQGASFQNPPISQTLVSVEYIRDAVVNVNVNLQSAEDTRAALTNLITILKNL